MLSQQRGYEIPVFVVMTGQAVSEKVANVRNQGASVFLLEANTTSACLEASMEISQSTGASLIPPSDHVDIALGQATAVFEFQQQMIENGQGSLDAIVLPSGGGGLLAGAAIFYKGSSTLVFGAEPITGGPRLADSLGTGRRLEQDPTLFTVADGLRSSIGLQNWELIRRSDYVRDVLTVGEDDILSAHRFLIESTSMSIEPSAAVAPAAVASNCKIQAYVSDDTPLPWRVGFVLTGGNRFLHAHNPPPRHFVGEEE